MSRWCSSTRDSRGRVTNWSFSWVNASNKTVRRSYFDLNVAGMAEYRDVAGTIGPDSWWHPTGHLRWAGDSAAEADLLETAALLVDWDYRVEMRTGAEVRRRFEAGLTVPDNAPVVFYPDEAWVHGRRLVARLVGDAVAAGAEQRFGAAVREIGAGGSGGGGQDGQGGRSGWSGWTVGLSDGTALDVDAVVNAAGPAAADIAALVGRKLPMRYEPGAVTRLSCAGSPLPIHRAMHVPHIELRPDGDNSIVLHSREIDALIDTGKDPADLGQLLHDLARAAVPTLTNCRITETRISNRPIPADGFPSVGTVPSTPGYYEAVTHSGITLGPILGRLLASEIVDGAGADLLSDFRPERFG
ncbi:NAD(P)/FAD-dependent oxidoreductase [Catenulispora yoronensis]